MRLNGRASAPCGGEPCHGARPTAHVGSHRGTLESKPGASLSSTRSSVAHVASRQLPVAGDQLQRAVSTVTSGQRPRATSPGPSIVRVLCMLSAKYLHPASERASCLSDVLRVRARARAGSESHRTLSVSETLFKRSPARSSSRPWLLLLTSLFCAARALRSRARPSRATSACTVPVRQSIGQCTVCHRSGRT